MQIEMDLKEKVLSSLAWSAIGRFLSQFLTWAVSIIVVRLLTAEDYGLISIAMFFIYLVATLSEFGLGASVIQERYIDERELRQIFGVLLVVNCFLFSLLLLTAPLIGHFFGEESVTAITRLLATQFLVMCFGTIPRSRILRKMDFKKLSIVDFTSAIVGSLITLALALTNYGVWSLVWGTLAYNICNVVMLNLMSPFLHLPRFSLKGMKRIMSFGGYVTLNGILLFCFTRADIFIIGKLLGKELLGFYTVGSNFSKLPMEKISPIISQVIFPAFARIQDDRRMAGAYFLKAVRITSLVAFPILWGVSSIASELVDILLGGKWQPSTVPIQLLSLIIPFFMIRNMLIPIMMGMGRADIAFLNSLFGAILLPLSSLIGIRWGLMGVSLAWVIALPLVLWENLLVTVPVLGITVSEVFFTMMKSFLAAVSMYAAIMAIKGFLGLDPKSVGYLVVLIITGITVYVGMIVILHEKGCREVLAVVKKLRISK